MDREAAPRKRRHDELEEAFVDGLPDSVLELVFRGLSNAGRCSASLVQRRWNRILQSPSAGWSSLSLRIAHSRGDLSFAQKLVLRSLHAGTAILTARAAVDLLAQPRFASLQKLKIEIEDHDDIDSRSRCIPAILSIVLSAPPCAGLACLHVDRVVRSKFGEAPEALARDDLAPLPALVPALREIGVSGMFVEPLRPLGAPGNRIERVSFAAGDESLRRIREWFPACRTVGLVDLCTLATVARSGVCAESLSVSSPDWTRPEDASDLARCLKAGTRRLRLLHTGPQTACGPQRAVPPSTDAAHGALLATLEGAPALESLALFDFPVGPALLAALERARSLRRLALHFSRFSDDGAADPAALAAALAGLPHLRALSLDRVPGLPKHFPATLKARCPRLQEIAFTCPESAVAHRPVPRYANPSPFSAFA